MSTIAPPERTRHRNPVALAAISVAVTAIAAMWIYAFFFASKDNPDKLPDRAWAARSEAICAGYKEQVDALPPARAFADIEPREEAMRQRADVGETANDLLAGMVADLRVEPPADDYSRKGADLWLADWDRYLEARVAHVEAWRQGIDQKFEEPPTVEGKVTPVSLRMDAFAKINRMASCQVPQDMG
jgi:hypothetical protein